MSSLVVTDQLNVATPVRTPKLYPAMWLITLLPVNILVLLDLRGEVIRPHIWAARLIPSLLALAPVAWATYSKTPRVLRIRKELRLLAPTVLLLLGASGLHLVGDAPMPLWLRAAIRLCAVLLTVSTVGAVAVVGWSEEARLGTLNAWVMSPRTAPMGLEKLALAAYFVVVSYLNVAGGAHSAFGEEYPELIAHLLAVTVGPAWFFLFRSTAYAALMAMVPFVLMGVSSVLHLDWAVQAAEWLMGAYALTMLATTVTRFKNVTAPPPEWTTRTLHARHTLWRLPPPLRVEQHLLYVATILPMMMPVVTCLLILTQGHADGLFVGLALAGGGFAFLAPPLTLTEAKQQLDQELVLHPRWVLFRRKLLSSLTVTAVGGIAVPLVLGLGTANHISTQAVAGFVVVTLMCWAFSVALSTATSGGVLVLAGVGVMFILVPLQIGSELGGASLIATNGQHLVDLKAPQILASLAVTIPAALAFAWRRFVHLAPRPVRDALVLTAACATYAFLLGLVSAALSPFLNA